MSATSTYFDRLVDRENLEAFLSEHFGSAERFEIEHLQEGHSNETLFVQWDQKNFVIRRPPPGEKAEKAHDVLREYRVLDALQETEVPVPTTLVSCDDHDVIGSDFFVMENVEGDVMRDEELERFGNPESRREIGEQLVNGLASIHQVDYEAIGLEEFGRPAGFTKRQVDIWSKQIIWAFSYTQEEREVPQLYEIGDWLKENQPEEYPHTLVHGDYKLDNVMFKPGTPPRINAIFDWEMSTLGDPLTDLGWMLIYWRESKDPRPPVADLIASFMEQEDYPHRRDLVERYEELTGITYRNDKFYRTLAVYKLAALGEMFFARHLLGDSDDPLYPKMEDGVLELADHCFSIINGEAPL